MRFYNYLTEEKPEIIIKSIEDKCQPFLKDWNGNFFLYSGRRKINDFTIKKIRKNRKPSDTPLEVHNLIDDWFYKNFGVRARSNSIFCIYNKSQEFYGTPHIVFPIGKYTSLYSYDIVDLYNQLEGWYQDIYGYDQMLKYFYPKLSKEKRDEFNEEILYRLNNNIKYKKGLPKYKIENEIMVVADSCFLVSTRYESELMKHFKEN